MRFRKLVAATAVAFITLSPLPSYATGYGVAVSPTSGLNSGDRITVTMSGLSGSLGVYASVCKQGATQMDTPAPCDAQSEMWITGTGAGGSSNGSASVAVSSTFSNVDCTVDSCVVYVRGDHNNQNDFSLIRTVSLSFAVGGPSRTPDSATAAYGSVTLQPNQPGNLKYRTPITLVVSATSGLPVSLVSLTPDCVISGNTVTALIGSGVCAIGATTAGNDTYAPLGVNFPFYVHLGKQKIITTHFVRSTSVGKRFFIAATSIRSNFGANVKVRVSTPAVCSIKHDSKGWTITGITSGSCKVIAHARAKRNLWTGATKELNLRIK